MIVTALLRCGAGNNVQRHPPPPSSQPPPTPSPSRGTQVTAPPGSTDPKDSALAAVAAEVEGGLLFGLGGFNCVASLLPPIILRVLSAAGFPFSREAGLAQLRACCLGGRVR